MPANSIQVIAALLALVLLTFVVGTRLLFTRVQEMRQKRIHPQAASTSVQMAARLENVQAADNFRNLFEVPVMFYALGAVALATQHTPGWLVGGAWAFVGLRIVHSFIHCTYNKVMHRLAAFLSSFVLLVALWVSFFLSLPGATAAARSNTAASPPEARLVIDSLASRRTNPVP
ncbi:MAG: MAPEG family protein [Rhodoferax sp.]|nr:MAPEG family protein [Rhodoferax sp.]